MRKIYLFFVLIIVTCVAAHAAPAMPGFSKVTQSDGSTLTVQAVGDEWYSLLYTADGLVVERGNDGDFYYVTTSGLSKVKAHDAAQRDMAEISFVNANKGLMSLEAIESSDVMSGKQDLIARSVNLKKVSVPQTESPRIPIILVQFKDKSMSNSYTSLNNHFSDETGSKSVYKYFKDQSNGQFTPQFDVYGIYTLENNRAYYGRDGNSRDQGLSGSNGRGKVVQDAIIAAGTDIDWSQYDNDNNGRVDVVMVVYAGVGQAQATSVTDALWPCRWSLDGAIGSTMYRNGKTINDFAIFNEVGGKYDSNTALDGIGTFCHEFSHCLGLPDFYVTGSSGYSNTGLSDWSVMANGCYDGSKSSDTPIGYSAFEKHFMGWMNYIEPNEGNQYSLPVLNNQSNPNDQAVVVKALYDTPYKYEYWVLEYRKAQGWDINIPAEGVLISHYTYIYDKWNSNQANYLNQLQGAEIVGSAYGKGYKTSFTSTTSPAMKAYLNENGTDCHSNPIAVDKPVTDIKVNNDGTASLWYMKGSTPALNTPVIGDATNVNATSFTANWTHSTNVNCTYTLNVTKNGATVLEQEGITNNSYNVTGLTSGETYSFKVKAVPVNSTQASQSDWSNIKTVTLPQAPTIAVSTNSVNFSGFATMSYTNSVEVTGINLSQNITATLNDQNHVYSIDKNSISSTANGVALNITWAPASAGTTVATITLSSAGAQDVTINLSGEAQLAVPTLTTSTSALSFTAAPNTSVTKTVAITGMFISNKVNLTLNDPSNKFSITPTSIEASNISENTPVNVSVTFKGGAVGTYTGSLTISSEGAESKTVTLTANASEGGNASDAYLNIANYESIDEAGADVDGMLSIYHFDGSEDQGYGWLTVSNYGAVKADATQGWIVNSLTKLERGTWSENDVFPASNVFFGQNTSYKCDWNGEYQLFYVTNCTQVKQYVNNRVSFYPFYMRIYECNKNASGELVADENPVDVQQSSVYGSESQEVITSSELSADKIYKVELFNGCSYMYATAFKTEFNSTPATPTATLSATPGELAFSCYAQETTSDTITVTGANLTQDVTVALEGDNDAFTISKPSITMAEAEATAKVVVTFNPQAAGEYTGTVTFTSGNLTQAVALSGEATAMPQQQPELAVSTSSLAFNAYAGYETTGTFTVTGQRISDDVILTCNGEGFDVSLDTIPASDLANGGVDVTVYFQPATEGSFEGNITLTTGNVSQTVELSGEATYNVIAPIASMPFVLGIGSDYFVGRWTSCPGATSYTVRVMPKPQEPEVPNPTTTLLVSDNFEGFTQEGDTDISGSLNSYMQSPGWTGDHLYERNHGLMVGSNSYTGRLITPGLNLANSGGKVTIKVKAYNPSTASQYQNTNVYVRLGSSSTILATFNVTKTEQEFTAVLDCLEADGQTISLTTEARKYRAVITNIEVYSGDVTIAPAPAPMLNSASGTRTFTGITGTSYKITGLSPSTEYIYDVKAVYGDQESEWSAPVTVKTFKKLTHIDDLIINGRKDSTFIISDDLHIVFVNPVKGRAWCKDNGKSFEATEMNDGQIDFMREITGEQVGDWDQSNWIMLQFPADNGNNGIKEMLENAVGKTIVGGTLAGRYTDDVNYTLEVIPEDDNYTLQLADAAEEYVANLYCTANFMTSNLNVNGGNGALGRINGNDVYYFFMNPKIQEVCEITNAMFDEDGVFVIPHNDSQISGSLKVDWSYNADGIQWPNKGEVYRFMAVVNRVIDNDNSYYIVYPLNFTTNGSSMTAINTVDGSRDVVDVKYVNVSGLVSDKPFSGVNIVVTRYTDGTKTTTKKLYK